MTIVLTLISFPNLKVFAYTGGLLNGLPLYQVNQHTYPYLYTDTATPVSTLTDNSTSTSYYLTFGQAVYRKFSNSNTVTDYQFKSANGVTTDFSIDFLDQNGGLIKSVTPSNIAGTKASLSSPVNGVYEVVLRSTYASGSRLLLEFDVFGQNDIRHDNVSNLTGSTGYTTVNLSWTNPSDTSNITYYKVYRDGVLMGTVSPNNSSFSESGLSEGTNYNYRVSVLYSDTFETTGITTTLTTGVSPKPPADVTSVIVKPDWNKVDLSWKNPSSTNFNKVNIYRNGTKIGTTTESVFTDPDVVPNTSYTYVLKAASGTGLESNGVTVTTKTLQEPPPDDVKGVKALPDWNRVKLTWTNPTSINFNKVNIYRSGIKVGESTDGTFTDSDVKPETNYSYVLKSVSVSGLESNGVTVNTVTLQEPPPVLTNTKFQRQYNGDLKISWEKPTAGKVQILTGGKLYATTSAADQQYVIPSKDVKRDVYGDPDVKIIPISDSGLIGNPVEYPKTTPKVPFTVGDLVVSGNNILWYIGPLLLLALSFLLVPKLRNIVFAAFKGNPGKRGEARIQGRTEKREKQEREAARETKERGTTEVREERTPRAPRMAVRRPREARGNRVLRETREIVERSRREPREPRERRY